MVLLLCLRSTVLTLHPHLRSLRLPPSDDVLGLVQWSLGRGCRLLSVFISPKFVIPALGPSTPSDPSPSSEPATAFPPRCSWLDFVRGEWRISNIDGRGCGPLSGR